MLCPALPTVSRLHANRVCSYVSGRKRPPGECNGKSGNLNHCLRNVIYAAPNALAAAAAGGGARRPHDIPLQEVIVVFDADMVACQTFFRRVLEVMWDDNVALCLTPQGFSNIRPTADIWNHVNPQYARRPARVAATASH